MAQNDNVVFKTSTTATIDDLFSWNKSTGQITAKTDNIPIVPGTVYFTADGHIVHDLAQNNRLWMSKNAYSAIYAEDITETNTDIANAIKYSIHYVEGPTTDTTEGTWTGTINGITELYDGLTIIYVPAVAGSSTTTLNINGLGAKTCYYNNTSTITTHYSVGTPILLTYRNNRWRRADYNNNTTYSAMSVAEMRAGTATSLRTIRADYLKTFLSTLGGTNLTLTHSNSAPYLQLNHDPSGITAGTYGNSSQQTPSYGGTFNIPYFTVDTQGHITNASTTTVKLPASDNTDYKVRQTPINSNDNNNYRILLSNSANDTEEDSISKKNANLIYNPTENKLSTGNLDLTGNINVVGNATFNNTTTIDNAILNSLLVSGNSSFANNVDFTQIPTAPTATAGTSTTQIATTEFVTNAVAQGFVANDAMVFKGLIGSNQLITQLPTSGYNAGWTYRVANVGIFAGEYCEVGDLLIAINDGPASGSSVINADWGKVEHNIDGAVFRGSGASNSSVGSSTQPVYVNGSGIVTAITGAIANDITGNAATATTASKLSNNSKIGDTNKPVYFKADGTPAAINYTIQSNVPSGAVFTDRYVDSAIFADDSTNTAASPVKMTLTRAGSDTTTVTANIPKVSSSSAGVAPKGTAVSSQSQSTKFLREDGTWAVPSYTVNTNTDTLVKQTVKTDNVNYKILMTTSGSPTSGNANEAAYDAGITINPSTHTLTASNLKGILSTQDLKRPTGLRGILNDVTLQSLVNVSRANRLAFLPADQIIIEKTTDGGATWVDAGISDANKLGLFSETRPTVALPMINGARNILCGLRITITAMKYNVPNGTSETEKYNYWNSTYVNGTERYCQLKDMYFWLNAVKDSIGVTVQGATGENPNSWSTIFNDSNFYMTGWSGCNYINFSQNPFGGFTNQTTHYWNYRITLMTKGVNGTNTMATSNTTTPQGIMEIRGYGDTVWTVANNYMSKDHIYSFDANQNTTFPANVTATKFVGSLEGNAATATTARSITSTGGTTANFWRGDNTWSNILAQTAETTLGIDTSNLRIGTTIRTLHIATSSSGSGTEVADGQAAGITFGAPTAAYAGIYYQSSGKYGSRLYFATTGSFANGAFARMMITHDGKVGIGTVTPSQKLEVNGNINVYNIYPIITEVYNLGNSTKKWNYVYANYFNGNGSNLTNLNANNIATGTLSTARGGTGSNSFAANRLIYTSNATTLSSTSNIYSDGSKLAINTTSMIDEADTFEVNGMSYLAGEVITNGTISPVENGIYDLGTEDYRWNKIYVNKFDPDVFLQNINVTLSSTWQNIQNNGADIELPYDGTYIIQIYDNTTSVGHYQAYWSGIFSWYTGNISGITNSNGYEYSEIPLHGSGQAINTKNIYLRTYSQNSSKMRLQIKGNNNLTSSTSNVISIKIKYIM